MAVGNAVIDIISKKTFLDNVKKNSLYFHQKLNELKEMFPKIIKEIRGRGFLIGIQLHKDNQNLLKNL